MRKTILILPLMIALTAVLAFALVQRDSGEATVLPAAMSLRVDASQTVDCAGGPVPGKVCVPLNQKFDVFVVADGIPLNGYIISQAWIDYGNTGLVHKKNTQFLWPDCSPIVTLDGQDLANTGAWAACITAAGPPHPISFHLGDLYSFSLTCTDDKTSHQIELLPAGHPIAGTSGALYQDSSGNQFVPFVTGINVNCVNPPNLTPTPVKPPAIDVQCTNLGGGAKQTKCTHAVGTQVEILGFANYAQDTDKNGTAGYHGVDIQVTWPPTGLGVDEKRTGLTCPPGAIAAKAPNLTAGEWSASCHLGTQVKADQIPPCPIQPDVPYPEVGCDTFDSNAAFEVNITGVGSFNCVLAGPVQVVRYNDPISGPLKPPVKPKDPGTRAINTQISFMLLQGGCVSKDNPGLSIPAVVRIRDAADKPFAKSIGQV